MRTRKHTYTHTNFSPCQKIFFVKVKKKKKITKHMNRVH